MTFVYRLKACNLVIGVMTVLVAASLFLASDSHARKKKPAGTNQCYSSSLAGDCSLSGGKAVVNTSTDFICCWKDWGCFQCLGCGKCEINCSTPKCIRANAKMQPPSGNDKIFGGPRSVLRQPLKVQPVNPSSPTRTVPTAPAPKASTPKVRKKITPTQMVMKKPNLAITAINFRCVSGRYGKPAASMTIKNTGDMKITTRRAILYKIVFHENATTKYEATGKCCKNWKPGYQTNRGLGGFNQPKLPIRDLTKSYKIEAFIDTSNRVSESNEIDNKMVVIKKCE